MTTNNGGAGKPVSVSSPGSRGGYRGTAAQARFTAQLVALDTPKTRDRVKAMADQHRISQAKILRAIVAAGIDHVETGLSSGTLSPDALV